jgi:hypothetical protein
VEPAPRSAAALDERARFPLCRREALTLLFEEAGLAGVRTGPITITTRFAGFDDYWHPFLGGTGPAQSYVASLDPARREALAKRLAEGLPTGPDGMIRLPARAWAVRGS